MDSEDTPVVVHCAGRTRSIVGTSILHRMGIKNVFGLRNGTMGWQLAGFDLEHGSDRLTLDTPSNTALEKAEAHGRKVAAEDGVQYLDIQDLSGLHIQSRRRKTSTSSTSRSIEEFESGHVPGFWWYPGGPGRPGERQRSRRKGRAHSLLLRWRGPSLGHRLPLPPDRIP